MVGINLSLLVMLYNIAKGPWSDRRRLPVHHINHLAFPNIYSIAPEKRDRRSFATEVWWYWKTPSSCQDQFHFILNTGKLQVLFVFYFFIIFFLSLYYTGWAVRWKSKNYYPCPRQNSISILKNEHDNFNLHFPSNNLDFFWGVCVVYLDNEVIFTFLANSYPLLASSTTYNLTSYWNKLVLVRFLALIWPILISLLG